MNANHRDENTSELNEARLTAYALSQLHDQERAAVEAQLAGLDEATSAKLRRSVEEIQALAGHLREASRQDPAPQPSPALRASVQRRLNELEGSPMATTQDPSSPKSRPWHRRRWLALALAGCLLIAAVPLYFAIFGPDANRRQVALSTPAPSQAAKDQAEGELRQTLDELKAEVSSRRESLGRMSQLLRAKREGEEAYQDASDEAAASYEAAARSLLEPRAVDNAGKADSDGNGLLEDTTAGERPSERSSLYTMSGMPGRSSPTASAPTMPGMPAPPEQSPSGSGMMGMGPSASPGSYPGQGAAYAYGRDARDRHGYDAYGAYDAGMSSEGAYGDAMPGYGGMPGGTSGRRSALDYGYAEDAAGTGVASAKEEQLTQPPERLGQSMAPSAATLPGGSPQGSVAFSPDGRVRAGDVYTHLGTHWSGQAGVVGGRRYEHAPRYVHAPPASTPGNEQYDAIAENELLAAASYPLSTFSIDVDTASYANVRRFLNEGRWPPPGAVRIEEMVNYFRYDYPPPEDEVPFSVHMEVAQCPWEGEHRLLRVGLKGREIEREQRGPSNLVFLLDVSGSMSDQNKLPLLKQAMRLLVEQLTEDDRVAIVTYASSAALNLESTCASNRQKILDVIDSLHASGSTHGSAGIQLAYEQAGQHFVERGTNRVILATDGDLNVGITEDDELVKLIRKKAKSGVFLTVLGFGTGNLKDSKLEKLADHGNGIYAYVDNLREARKVLMEQISASLVTIAKDVKIQIEFNPAEVDGYRLIGYENRILAARDFDDDKKDAGEIGAGHTVTALYELVPAERRAARGDDGPMLKYQRATQPPAAELTEAAQTGELLTLRLRYKEPDGNKSRLLEYVAKDSDKRFGEASPDFQFAAAVASFGMVLRGSQYAGELTLAAVEEFAVSGIGSDPGGYRAELVDLVRRARELSGH